MADQSPMTGPGTPPPAAAPLPSVTMMMPTAPAAGSTRPSTGWRVVRVLLVVILALSVLVNGILLAAVLGLVGMLSLGGTEDAYVERVIERGPASQKIAVLRVEGFIDEMMAESLHAQMVRAAEDKRVKAVILRIDSHGGGLTASDMIHNDVRTILAKKPVVAAMDAVAASGGYYVACSAGHVVAQPTTVTGSIGVIAEFFFLKGLLTDKLGVQTVTLKMGSQKDWPNMFAADMPPEQQEYIMTALLKPGYDQFIDIVTKSRKMPRDKVVGLATGRIFLAKEAKDTGLIDDIGYFDHAIKVAKQKAGITDARVVEYIMPFHLLDLLAASSASSRTPLGLDLKDLKPEKLASLAAPRVMYLWTGY